jgi:hypothetical protein
MLKNEMIMQYDFFFFHLFQVVVWVHKLFNCHTRKQGTSAMLVHLRNICKNILVGLVKMISHNQS